MPYVEGGDTPLNVYATNATFPRLNEWTHLNEKQLKQFGASSLELHRAKQAYAFKHSKHEARQAKHALFEAIMQGDVAECKRLLNPALLERHTPTGATPLILASAGGAEQIVLLLLEAGASVTATDGIGATALIMAAHRGHTGVVKHLLNSKQGGNAGRTYLLRQCTRSGETAVMAAAKGGHLDTLKALLEAGATAAVQRLDGVDALMLACKHDKVSSAQYLMQEQRINPGRVDRDGCNALMHAAAGAADQTTDLLLAEQPPLDIHAADINGLTALHHACLGGSPPIIKALAAKGAVLDPNDVLGGARLLALAAQRGHTQAVEWLVSQGIGRQALVEGGDASPIFAAVQADSVAGVEALLAAGARLETRDSRGRTPLAWAARHGRDRMVKLLISRGANLLAADVHGRVPRKLAQLHRHTRTAELLSDLAKDKLIMPDFVLDKEEREMRAALIEQYGEAGAPLILPQYAKGPVPPVGGPVGTLPLNKLSVDVAPTYSASADGSASTGIATAPLPATTTMYTVTATAAPAAPAAAPVRHTTLATGTSSGSPVLATPAAPGYGTRPSTPTASTATPQPAATAFPPASSPSTGQAAVPALAVAPATTTPLKPGVGTVQAAPSPPTPAPATPPTGDVPPHALSPLSTVTPTAKSAAVAAPGSFASASGITFPVPPPSVASATPLTKAPAAPTPAAAPATNAPPPVTPTGSAPSSAPALPTATTTASASAAIVANSAAPVTATAGMPTPTRDATPSSAPAAQTTPTVPAPPGLKLVP